MKEGKKEERETAILKYMHLRIKGPGTAITQTDIATLNAIPEPEWQGINQLIKELGGLSMVDVKDDGFL